MFILDTAKILLNNQPIIFQYTYATVYIYIYIYIYHSTYATRNGHWVYMSLYINLDKTVLDMVRKYDGDICTIYHE